MLFLKLGESELQLLGSIPSRERVGEIYRWAVLGIRFYPQFG